MESGDDLRDWQDAVGDYLIVGRVDLLTADFAANVLSFMRFSAQFLRVVVLNCFLVVVIASTIALAALFQGPVAFHDFAKQYFFAGEAFVTLFFIPLFPTYLYYRMHTWVVSESGIEMRFLSKQRRTLNWCEIKNFGGRALGVIVVTRSGRRFYLTFSNGIKMKAAASEYLGASRILNP